MSSSASSSRPLTRGAACLPCRKLKAKCDGNRPACGRCLANSRPDDCEYATGAEVTRSRLLEENIALLEARIRELENPGESAPSVKLHDPSRQAVSSVVSSRGYTPASTPDIQLYPTNPIAGNNISALTSQETQILVQSFLSHSSQLGFFLNPTKFLHRNQSPSTTDDALMNAVFLWGSRLSSSAALKSREGYFADRATQILASITMVTQATAPASAVLHIIQAEILVANYFFATGRLLEGRYHCLAAVALVTGSRLHQLSMNTLGNDLVAAGEKIRAFWTVACLDKEWAAAMNTPSSLCQSGRATIHVTTPWPLTIEAYEQGNVIPRHSGYYTIDEFVRGSVDDSQEDFSPLAIRTKAGALYDRAIYLASQYRPDIPNRNEFLDRFNSLDNLIERFHRQLAAIRNRGPDDMCELLVSRTFVYAAGIQLHLGFSSHQPLSWQKTLCIAVAAGRALETVDVNQYQYLDPIVAVLWSTVCKVLVGELGRIKRGIVPARPEDVASVTSSLDRITAAMTILASSCPLMATHLAEIQQGRTALISN